MTAFLPRHRYLSKPPPLALLDPSHPLAVGLVWGALLNEGTGPQINDSALSNAPIALPSGVTWDKGALGGMGLKLSGTAAQGTAARALNVSMAAGYTLAAWMQPGALVQMVSHGFSGANAGMSAYLQFLASNNLSLMISGVNNFASVGVSVTTWHHFAATLDVPGNAYVLYLDGKRIGSGTPSSRPVSTSITPKLTLANSGQGYIDMPLIWSRPLSAGEIALLVAEPFGFLHKPPTRRLSLTAAEYAGTIPATSGYTISLNGPATALIGQASSSITAALAPINSAAAGSTDVAFSDDAGGGSFSVPTVHLATTPGTTGVGGVAANPQSATTTYTPVPPPGARTLRAISSGAAPYTDPAPLLITVSYPPLLVGSIVVDSVSATTVQMHCTNTGGGYGTLHPTWHRSAVPGFTPDGSTLVATGNGVSGATTTTLVDASLAAVRTLLYYKCVITDDGGQSVATAHVPIILQAVPANLVLGFLGDSITGNPPDGSSPPPPERCAALLSGVYGIRSLTWYNLGESGSTSAVWATRGSGGYGTHGVGTPQPAGAAAWNSTGTVMNTLLDAGVTDIHYMMGTNDCRTPNSVAVGAVGVAGSYTDNVALLIAHAKADLPTLKRIILHYPPYSWPTGAINPATGSAFANPGSTWVEADMQRILSYQQALSGLVDNATVFLGDTSAYTFYARHPEYMRDNVHPNQDGVAFYAAAWAAAQARVLGLATMPYPFPPRRR